MYRQQDNIIRTEDTLLNQTELGGMGHFYFKYMKQHGEKTVQIDAITGETDTYHSLLQKCIRTSIELRKRGIAKGDLIVYYSGIHLNACVPVIASYFIGAILPFIDASLSSSEVSYLLKQVKPKLLLTDPENFEKIKQIIKNTDLTLELVIFYDDFFKQQDEEDSFKPIYVDNLKDTATIFFSSGSTGYPKGICKNHYSMFCDDPLYDVTKGEEYKVVFSFDSLYWIAEALQLSSITRRGMCNILANPDRFNLNEFGNLIEKYKVNIAFLIPLIISEMYKQGTPKGNTSSLKTIIVEGYRLHETYQKGFQEMLPHTFITQSYGMTEIGYFTMFSRSEIHQEYNKKKVGSVGVLIQGYGNSCKVVDLQTGESLGPNKEGELRVRSKFIMNGYYNLDSSDQFDKDGWFKTGDVVYYDEDYCFFVVDRIKHLLICDGWHIIPAFLEDELLSHPAVKRAIVIGIPQEVDGEHALALVVLNKGYENTTTIEIEKYMEERVSENQKLRGGIRFVDKIPLTPTGKVKRQELKRMVLSGEL